MNDNIAMTYIPSSPLDMLWFWKPDVADKIIFHLLGFLCEFATRPESGLAF